MGNLHLFDELEAHLRAGHNVVLLSNHQTEADPAVIALLLEHSHPFLAENLVRGAPQKAAIFGQNFGPMCLTWEAEGLKLSKRSVRSELGSLLARIQEKVRCIIGSWSQSSSLLLPTRM